MVYLREALVKDAAKLSEIAIRSKAHWGYDQRFIQQCKQDLTITVDYINQHHVFVLDSGEQIIGFFTFLRDKEDCLDFLYIDPTFIGKGYGRLLWKDVIEKARELEIKRFTIDSDPHAKGFYEKMGAIQIAEVPSTVFENRMLPLMEYTFEDSI
ncbi:GNAT family N-acetyltransferase [Piscibacillus halophilus]|uniref:GNAT family N-acetyltransferase n=1 Tax=Piscibacillus halophilus TaxID=571933 RepID=UPI00158DA312|nr:GNAT family N-acetyltransferase [Piscibacillus halophilus]